MNYKWETWAKASMAIYFNTLATALELKFTLNAVENVVPLEESDYINLRISGPEILPVTKVEHKILVGVEILLHLQKTNNIYNPEFYKGKIIEACYKCIPMIEAGFEDSTSDVLGNFQLRKVQNPVRVLEFFNTNQLSRACEIVFTAPYEITL